MTNGTGLGVDTVAGGDMEKLSFNLLGRLEVVDRSGRKLAITGKKPQALLTYLAANFDRTQSRDRLATLLWGDCPDDTARQNLRQCLSRLRKALCDGTGQVLLSEGDRVGLNHDLLDIDARKFLRCAKKNTPKALTKAVEFYRDEFADGLYVEQAEFEEWVRAERDRFRDLACDVLGRLVRLQENSGDTDTAIETAQRHISLDPLCEAPHRTLMRLYARAGRCAAALKQYQTYSTLLLEDLGTRPSPQTRRLFDQIQSTGFAPAKTDDRASDGIESFIPEKPTIAVLPFDNMSNSQTQEYFADGITENIITGLAKIPKLFVVARNSTFVYKGQAVDIRKVGIEQGARYVLKGSVQRGGNQVRIIAQLTDATTGHHRWAERFDRPLSDIFALQDEITRKIVSALQVNLTEGEQAQLWVSGSENIEAWELVVQANDLYNRHVKEDSRKAHKLLARAVGLDPGYVAAWCAWGWVHWMDARYGWGASVEASLADAHATASKAHEIDPGAAEPLAIFAGIALKRGEYEKAADLARRAVDHGAGHSMVLAFAGMVLSHCGHPKEAIHVIEKAMGLCPIYPIWYLISLSRAKRLSGDNEMALRLMREAWDRDQNGVNPTMLVAILADSDRLEEAKTLAAKIMRKNTAFSISDWAVRQTFRYPKDLQRFVGALKKAGLPQ